MKIHLNLIMLQFRTGNCCVLCKLTCGGWLGFIACFLGMPLGEVCLTGDYVLGLCPECGGKVVVWNVRDPYFMDREDAWKVYEQIREKVAELAKSQ